MLKYIIGLFRRGGPGGPKNINIKIMHNINRTAIILFVVGIILLIIKLFSSPE